MDRFERQRTLAGFGDEGQAQVGRARVLVVGVGGLGTPVARYLAAAGVGHLTLCDPGIVDTPDLHRQILYADGDEGGSKAELATQRLAAAHPDVAVVAQVRGFDRDLLVGHDLVIDGTDEAGTRAYVHQACVDAGIPLVWGSLEAWEAQLTTVLPGGPCLRCLWPEPGQAPACADVGVLGPWAGVAGCMMASEAIHVMLGTPRLSGRLLLLDGKTMQCEELQFKRRSDCFCCAPTK